MEIKSDRVADDLSWEAVAFAELGRDTHNCGTLAHRCWSLFDNADVNAKAAAPAHRGVLENRNDRAGNTTQSIHLTQTHSSTSLLLPWYPFTRMTSILEAMSDELLPPGVEGINAAGAWQRTP
jgi:hypothetical protein